MRRYDEPVEVRRGLVDGTEEPAQFVWRSQLWVVRTVLAHWTQTGAWWEQPAVHALLGTGTEAAGGSRSSPSLCRSPGLGLDLMAEREVWRVEAARGASAGGVFDLDLDWTTGQWRLVCVLD